MSKRKIPDDPNRPKKWPTGDYPTGYARPPKHGQIKPGEVRNRWGPKGKPKPVAIDPFEYAASQPTTVTIGGKVETVTAEVAAQLVNMNKAIAGDARAHKNVQDERRSRRKAGAPLPTAEEIIQQRNEQEDKEQLSAKIVKALELYCSMRKEGLLVDRDGRLGYAPWLEEAMADYRVKHGKDPN